MADTSVVFGLLLAIMGVSTYFGVEAAQRSPSALIPSAVGLVLIVLGAVARKESLRKHAMHAAAAVGLLGFLMAAGRFLYVLFTAGVGAVMGTGGLSTLAMAALCGVFVGLCVKSFIDARKRRKANAGGPTAP